jgi:hypothetical protein
MVLLVAATTTLAAAIMSSLLSRRGDKTAVRRWRSSSVLESLSR